MTNNGHEIELGLKPVVTQNFSWNLTTNFTSYTNKVKELAEGATSLNLKGLGNVYSNKVQMNEGVSKAIEEWNFYLVEGKVVVHKPVQNLTESEHKAEKPVINEQFNKMKHLTGYRPNEFVDTKNVKKNRGF